MRKYDFDKQRIFYDEVYDRLMELNNDIKSSLRYEEDMPTIKEWREAFEYFLIGLKKQNRLGESILSNKRKHLNELNTQTYMNAARKAKQLNQFNRANRFANGAQTKFRRDNETNEINITTEGFEMYIPKGLNKPTEISYDLADDVISVYYPEENTWDAVEPGDYILRTEDRKIIRTIINYFNEFNPDSKYNDKNLFIL